MALKFVSRVGIVPPVGYYTIKDLEQLLVDSGFKLLETVSLGTKLTDYFIVAQKQ